MKYVACMADDASRSLGGQALTPAFFPDHEGEFNLISALDEPWQQSAPTQKLTGLSVNSSPQAQFGMIWVATYEPFEFLFGFLIGSSSVRKVLSDLRIAIERIQLL